jgi:hypothetical protein
MSTLKKDQPKDQPKNKINLKKIKAQSVGQPRTTCCLYIAILNLGVIRIKRLTKQMRFFISLK